MFSPSLAMPAATSFWTGPLGSLSPIRWPRRRRVDLRQHVLHQLLEVRGAGDEVRFAVHFDERARGVVGRQPLANQAFVGRSSGFFRGTRQAALAQNGVRLVEVAIRFAQRVLAFHHPRAGLVAELLHVCGGDRRHKHLVSW
jgi:hypothetical protein